MVREYPYICRLPLLQLPKRGKKYLTDDQMTSLFASEVVIEEKLDGSTESWEQDGYIIYAEDMRYIHNIQYGNLPDRYIIIDIWDTDHWLGHTDKEAICNVLDLAVVPLIYSGITYSYKAVQLLGSPSAFGADSIEGIVIKNYKHGITGKIVDPGFDTEVDNAGHWRQRMEKQVIRYSSVGVID